MKKSAPILVILTTTLGPGGAVALAEGGPNPARQPRAIFLVHGIKGGPFSFGDLEEILSEELNPAAKAHCNAFLKGQQRLDKDESPKNCGKTYCQYHPNDRLEKDGCHTNVLAVQYDTLEKKLYEAGVTQPDPYYFSVELKNQMMAFYRRRHLDPKADPFSLVVHSQGGLVSMAYLDRCIKKADRQAKEFDQTQQMPSDFPQTCARVQADFEKNGGLEPSDVQTLCKGVMSGDLYKSEFDMLVGGTNSESINSKNLHSLIDALNGVPCRTSKGTEVPRAECVKRRKAAMLGAVEPCGTDAPKNILQLVTLDTPFWGSPIASGTSHDYDKLRTSIELIEALKADFDKKKQAFKGAMASVDNEFKPVQNDGLALPEDQLYQMAYGSPSVVHNRRNLFLTAQTPDGITTSPGKPAFKGTIPADLDIYNFAGIIEREGYPMSSQLGRFGHEMDTAVSVSSSRLDFYTYWEGNDSKTGLAVPDSSGKPAVIAGRTHLAEDHFIPLPDAHVELPDFNYFDPKKFAIGTMSVPYAQMAREAARFDMHDLSSDLNGAFNDLSDVFGSTPAPECISCFLLGRDWHGNEDQALLAAPDKRMGGKAWFKAHAVYPLLKRILLGERLSSADIHAYLDDLQRQYDQGQRSEPMLKQVKNFASDITILLPHGMERKLLMSPANIKMRAVSIDRGGNSTAIDKFYIENTLPFFSKLGKLQDLAARWVPKLPHFGSLRDRLLELLKSAPYLNTLFRYNYFNFDRGSIHKDHNYETFHHEGLFTDECAYHPLDENPIKEGCRTAIEYTLEFPGWQKKTFQVEVGPSYTSYSFVHLEPYRPIPPALSMLRTYGGSKGDDQHEWVQTLGEGIDGKGNPNPRWSYLPGSNNVVYVLNHSRVLSPDRSMWMDRYLWIERPRSANPVLHDSRYDAKAPQTEPQGYSEFSKCYDARMGWYETDSARKSAPAHSREIENRNRGYLYSNFLDEDTHDVARKIDIVKHVGQLSPHEAVVVLGRFNDGKRDRYLITSPALQRADGVGLATTTETKGVRWVDVNDLDILNESSDGCFANALWK